MKNRATAAGERSHFKNKKISIHARTLPVFVLNPHSPRRKGNEQEVHKHALLTPAQPPFREHKQLSELNISSAQPNLYPVLFTKQYQGLFLRASRGKSTAKQHSLQARQADRAKEPRCCQPMVDFQLGEQDFLRQGHAEDCLSVFQESLPETHCRRQIRSRYNLFKDSEYLHYWLNWHLNEHLKPLSRTERGMPEVLARSRPSKDEHNISLQFPRS